MPVRGSFRMSTGAGGFATPPSLPAAPRIDSLSIDDTTPALGATGTLSWSLSGGTPTQQIIDWGDATSNSTISPGTTLASHQYNDAGTFTATLTVSNAGGSDSETIAGIVVSPVVGDPPPVITSFTVDDASLLTGQQATYSWTTSGSATAWSLDTDGDGDADWTGTTETSRTHTYGSAGSYTPTLTISGPGGSDSEPLSGGVVVTVPPISITGFSVTPTDPIIDVAATFSWTTSGQSQTGATLDPGDGTTPYTLTTQTSQAHTYDTEATYDATLVVTGASSSDTETLLDIDVIQPPAAAPVVSFTLSTTSGDAPLSVTCTDTSTNSPTSWLWHFIYDDQLITSTAQNPTVSLTPPGMWTVKLWATNATGTGYDALVQGIIATTPSPGYDVVYDHGGTANPLVLNQITQTSNGTNIKLSPTPPAGSVTDWRLNQFHGASLTGNAQIGTRLVTTGLRTIGARITQSDGTEIVIAKQANVVSQGYAPTKTHTPVPTKGWGTPAGETVMTTETRFNEASTGSGKRPDRWVLRFDPGEVASGETLIVRDDAGNEINWGMVEQATHDDGSLASCKIVCWIDISTGSQKTYWILKKTGSRTQGSCSVTNSDVAAALGSGASMVLEDVRHAEDQSITLGTLTLDVGAAITASHAQRQNECPIYFEIKTSGYYRNSVPADTNEHALIPIEVWKHPDTGAITAWTCPITIRAFLEDYEAAIAGTTTGIRELIYKAKFVVNGVTVRDFTRTKTFAASAINTTTNGITLAGNGIKSDDYVCWRSGSTLPSGIELDIAYPVTPYGYLGRYDDTGFWIRPKTSFNRADAAFDFTDQGSGTHTVETFIYQAAGKGWCGADIDGRWLVMTGVKSEIVPSWYRDELVWRIKRGMFVPLDLDVPDDGGEPDYPAEYFNYYPGTNGVGRPNRDNAGGDDMIGLVHRLGARAMRCMQTSIGRQALRAVRIGALENASSPDLWLYSNRAAISGRPAYLPEVLNNGPDDAGGTFPNMGPSRPLLQIHPNFYNPGYNSVRLGGKGQMISGSLDCSHPDHCSWHDYPLTGSRVSLEVNGTMWTRSNTLVLSSSRNITVSGTTYYGGITILNAGGLQGRSSGYLSKFLSNMLYIGDDRPERAYYKKTIDNNIACLDAYFADETEMAPLIKAIGANSHYYSDKGGEQSWWMHLNSIGCLFLLKARGKFEAKPASVQFATAFSRLLVGDRINGKSLRGHPGMNQTLSGFNWSSLVFSLSPYPTHDFKPASLGDVDDIDKLTFDSQELFNCTSGNPTLTRVRANEMTRKIFNGTPARPSTFASGSWSGLGFDTTKTHYVCNVSADGTTYQLSTTYPTLNVVTPTASRTGMRVFSQLFGRGSTTTGYGAVSSALGGDGEYTNFAGPVLSMAAVWGRTDLIPHARIANRVARGGWDDMALSSHLERMPNNAVFDFYLRYKCQPEYPPLS